MKPLGVSHKGSGLFEGLIFNSLLSCPVTETVNERRTAASLFSLFLVNTDLTVRLWGRTRGEGRELERPSTV